MCFYLFCGHWGTQCQFCRFCMKWCYRKMLDLSSPQAATNLEFWLGKMLVFLNTRFNDKCRFLGCICMGVSCVSLRDCSLLFLLCVGWIWTATAAFPERHEGSDQSEVCEWSGCRWGWYWPRWCLQRVSGRDNKEGVWPCTQFVQGMMQNCRCWPWRPIAERNSLAYCTVTCLCADNQRWREAVSIPDILHSWELPPAFWVCGEDAWEGCLWGEPQVPR